MTNIQPVAYRNVRSSIKNGDLIFMSGDSSFSGKLISWVTKSSIFHAGIAVWLTAPNGERILCSVEQWYGGRRVVNLSHYAHQCDLIVVENPVKDFGKYSTELLANTGQAYSMKDFAKAGIYDLFGVKMKNSYGEICSEMIMRIINQHLKTKIYEILSPGTLYTTVTATLGSKVLHNIKREL